MTTDTAEQTFTIPVRNGRPLIVRGTVLATRSWTGRYEERGQYRENTPMRARLIETDDGLLIYHQEAGAHLEQRQGYSQPQLVVDESVWQTFQTGIFRNRTIPQDWLIEEVKLLLRDAGLEDLTYEALSDRPYTCVVPRNQNTDLAFNGRKLAEGKATWFGDMLADTALYALTPGSYLVVRNRGCEHHRFDTALEVYEALVWPDPQYRETRNWMGIYESKFFKKDYPPEPNGDTVRLLEQAAAADPAFRTVAYRIAGETDPALRHYRALRAEYQERAAAALQKAREEEAQREAAEKKRREEEAERERVWQEQEAERRRQEQEEYERNQRENAEQEVEPVPPTPQQLAWRILQQTVEDESAPQALRIQAAGWINLANIIHNRPTGYDY